MSIILYIAVSYNILLHLPHILVFLHFWNNNLKGKHDIGCHPVYSVNQICVAIVIVLT